MDLSKILSGANNFLGEVVNPTNAIGQVGKAISQASGGPWGDALTILDQQSAQQNEQGLSALLKKAQLAKLMRPETVGNPETGVYQFGDDGGLTQLLAPMMQDPKQTSLMQNFDWYKGLNPEDQKLAAPMMQGYGNTDAGMQSRIAQAAAIANAQGAARANYRAPPQSNLGRSKGNPVPVNSREALQAAAPGTWVSLPDGTVTQRR